MNEQENGKSKHCYTYTSRYACRNGCATQSSDDSQFRPIEYSHVTSGLSNADHFDAAKQLHQNANKRRYVEQDQKSDYEQSVKENYGEGN
jgi:hypothetical protein